MADDPIRLLEETELRLHQELQNIADETRQEFERLRLGITEQYVSLGYQVARMNGDLSSQATALAQIQITLGRLEERMDNADNAISRLVTVTDRLDQSITKLDVTTARLESTVAGLDSKFELVVDRIDDRIDTRVTRATWVMLGGVATIVAATAGVFALFA